MANDKIMTTSNTDIALGLCIVLLAFTVFFLHSAYAAPDESVWAGGEKGVRLVPVFYVDTVYCNGFNLHGKGCYDPNADYITIKTGYRDVWTPRGCTVLQHEQTHAWGFYDEVSVGTLFNCDNPNDKSETQGLYDPNNFFHFAPKQDYVVKVYDWDPDPRITKLQ